VAVAAGAEEDFRVAAEAGFAAVRSDTRNGRRVALSVEATTSEPAPTR
jgi:hypothetical protein